MAKRLGFDRTPRLLRLEALWQAADQTVIRSNFIKGPARAIEELSTEMCWPG